VALNITNRPHMLHMRLGSFLNEIPDFSGASMDLPSPDSGAGSRCVKALTTVFIPDQTELQ
jgi:hypothetical protein